MLEHCKEIIKKLAAQSIKGKISIGDEDLGYWNFFVKFNIQLEGEEDVKSKYPTFKINSNELFFKNLADYLVLARKFYEKDQSYFSLSNDAFDEKLILDILINATNYDMQNMEAYLEQRTRMLKENLSCITTRIGDYGECSIYMEITKNKSNLEAPFKFTIFFENEEKDKFVLPSITFGIENNLCHMYAIQTKKEKQTNKLAKKLDRHFRKLNKDVDMDDIMANISTNALVALVIFIEYLKTLNLTSIHAHNFMPIRYNSNKVVGYNKHKDHVEEFLQEHDRNQYNITNKLMYLIVRYNHHFKASSYDYDDIEQAMHLNILNCEGEADNNVIYELQRSVFNSALTP